jgi:TPR repeat protein
MAVAAPAASRWLVAQASPQNSGDTGGLKALSDKAFAADKAHDYAAAMQWFFKMAEEEEKLLHSLNSNNSNSFSRIAREADLDVVRYEIGHHYEFGLGVPQDYEKAKYWYQQAKSDPDAAARLKQLDAGTLPRNADDASAAGQPAPMQERQEQPRPHPPPHERDWSVGNWACNAWAGTSPWNIMSGCNQ